MKHNQKNEIAYNFRQKTQYGCTTHPHLLLRRYAIASKRSNTSIKTFVSMVLISLITMACLPSSSKVQLTNEDGPWVVAKVMEFVGSENLDNGPQLINGPYLIVWGDVLRRNEKEIRILYYSPSVSRFAVGDELYVDGLIGKNFASDFNGYWYGLLVVRKADEQTDR